MHDRLHKLLVWLLCALLVGAGVPAQRRATCTSSGTAAPIAAMPAPAMPAGCCSQSHTCCCPKPQAKAACGCELPHPQPAPPPPAPKQPLLGADAEWLPVPQRCVPPIAVRAPPRAAVAVRQCMLPRCSRQEALSIWRL